MYKADSLTPNTYQVLIQKGTEAPFVGQFTTSDQKGTYLCRLCGLALFRSAHKFISSCGWPSFDDEIPNTIERSQDPDGMRIEIHCMRCKGHLGHVFENEHLTQKNLRHCVNSLSLDFSLDLDVLDTEEIIVAGGCFWGLEHYLSKEPGVVFTQSGYIGGNFLDPRYQDICKKNTGHYEAVRVLFDSSKTNHEALYKAFFELHDPTQEDGQGPDLGPQYKSALFYYNDEQRKSAERLLQILSKKGLNVVTEIKPVSPFWPAEEEHQNYLIKNPGGYCSHKRVRRF